MAGRQVYLDVWIGDSKQFLRDQDAYNRTRLYLDKHATSYGLPSRPEELADWQKEILQGIDASQGYETPLRFEHPESLLAGRLVFELSASPKLAKTTANFVALCTGEKGTCKGASNRRLHYLECPIHRIAKGFIAQGGDILRGDGSGGEVGPPDNSRLPISLIRSRAVHLWRRFQSRGGGFQGDAPQRLTWDGEFQDWVGCQEHVTILCRAHGR